ncbi:MAG: ribosome-associated translation inhibitor RaiA [Muribaculaceae bacterium]|nr:ribosome-associated translation inhibitor RaiA [Muribaculaceae bacterium]
MKVTVNAIHFDASEKLVNFINRKVDKLTKHHDNILDAEVTLKVVKPETSMNKEVSVKISYPDQAAAFASKTADTFEEAVDNCIDALKKQLEKVKAKHI